MHCPSCGQQQVSNETKFCSRCGMPLAVVAEVLIHGGFLPQLEQLSKKRTIFTKKNGVVFAVFWFIFLTMFSTAFFGILGAPDAFIGLLAITGVFGAMMITIASLIFFPSSKPPLIVPGYQVPSQLPLYGTGPQAALPPPQSVPANIYGTSKAGSWRDTNDLQPASVTESTTRLLNEDDRQER